MPLADLLPSLWKKQQYQALCEVDDGSGTLDKGFGRRIEDCINSDMQRSVPLNSVLQQQGQPHAKPGVDLENGTGQALADQAVGEPKAARGMISWLWDSGTACVATAAVFFAFSVLAVKLLGSRIPVLEITTVRSSLSLAVTLAIARLRGVTPMFGHRPALWKLIGRGVSGSMAMATYYAAVVTLPLGDATVLFFTNPAITAVMAWLILGEHLGGRGALGSLLSLVGLVVLVHPPFLGGGHADWGPRRLLGVACGAASALFSSGAFIFIRFIGKAEPALVVALYFHACTVVLSIGPLAAGWPQRATLPSASDAALLGAIAVTSFAGQLLLTRGFQLESASRAASINFSQVIYSYIFGIAFFSEGITWAGAGGSVLIAVGIFLVNAKARPTATVPAAAAGNGSGEGAASPPGQRGGAGAGPARRSAATDKLGIAARDAAGAGVGSIIALSAMPGLLVGGGGSDRDGSRREGHGRPQDCNQDAAGGVKDGDDFLQQADAHALTDGHRGVPWRALASLEAEGDGVCEVRGAMS